MGVNSFPNVARNLKNIVYCHFPDYLSYEKGNYKDILLFASRRSGSTYTARLLSCDRGVRYIDQPFELFYPNTNAERVKCAYLPSMPLSQFITLSDEQKIIVREYMSLILSGRLKPLGGIERWGFPFLGGRTVLKICNASPLLDWFSDQFDVSIVYLLRHPIPQALSIIRNNWGLTAEAYANNQGFCTSYLGEDKIKLAKEVLTKGTYFQKAILNWALENIFPLKHRKSEVLVITYEELLLNPVAMIRLLSEKLKLENTKRMLKMTRIPSQPGLSEEKTKEAIREGEASFLVGSWRKRISDEELNHARTILETFGIFEYRVDRFLPTDELIHFPCRHISN